MNCPKCRQEPMRSETHSHIAFERCPVCKGIYLDEGDLERLVSETDAGSVDTFAYSPVSQAMDDVHGYCFRCDQQMTSYVGPAELRLDKCERCGGTFLDQGELATLQLHAS